MSEPEKDEEDHRTGANRQTASLAGLALALALLVAGLWLYHALREKSKLEDCLMAGRRNCAPIVTN